LKVGRCSVDWTIPPALFFPVILDIGSCFLHRLAWTAILLFCTSHHCCNDTYVPVCSVFFHWDKVSWTFCPGWPQTATLQISASQVAKIIGVSHLYPT
jgi:hypothetical protein